MQRSIFVDLAKFRIDIFEYDAVVRTITNFAIGRQGHRTPMFEDGSISPTKRCRDYVSHSYPKPHGGAKMPFALFFKQDEACAFHEGSAAVPSHGCIHLEPPDARWLFAWAGSAPIGLTIRGPYPASSVPPQRLYRFGAGNMLVAVVRQIQQALAAAGLDPGQIDGEFRDKTDEAVRAFQARHGLVEDGIVGRDTATALGIAW
ncbi:L,D-transpeptidase family protein [Sphingomonas profundi]|uniref:L,D-transpeptidase family protein n=1 Tax=Alterirhizorhabdus profundi TaxID=2681549 RepID=UPI0018CFFD27|nr:peptidoglycan-binding protein [Sphingomonas profundi]